MTYQDKTLAGRNRSAESDLAVRLPAFVVVLAERLLDLRRRRDLPEGLRNDVGLPPRAEPRDWRDLR